MVHSPSAIFSRKQNRISTQMKGCCRVKDEAKKTQLRSIMLRSIFEIVCMPFFFVEKCHRELAAPAATTGTNPRSLQSTL